MVSGSPLAQGLTQVEGTRGGAAHPVVRMWASQRLGSNIMEDRRASYIAISGHVGVSQTGNVLGDSERSFVHEKLEGSEQRG